MLDEVKTILVVDDQIENLQVMKQILSSEGYRLIFAKNGHEALQRARQQKPDLILLDIMMPEMDGYQVCQALKADLELASIPVIFVTTMRETQDEEKGFSVGAVDYIEKPVQPGIVRARVRNHLSLVQVTELEKTRSLIIQRLGRAAEYKDNETGWHTIRMSHYSRLLAQKMGMPESWCETLLNAAPMHDIGKIGISDKILLKPGPLDAEEWEAMQTHAKMGANIIGKHKSKLLEMARVVALSHHEKWDGSGYPSQLKGEAIPLEARIVAIADVFDALTTRRAYKTPWTVEEAVTYIQAQSGRHFDPKLVELFVQILDEILAIRDQWPEH